MYEILAFLLISVTQQECIDAGFATPTPTPLPSPSPSPLPSPSPIVISPSPSPSVVPSPKPTPVVVPSPSPSPAVNLQGEDESCQGLTLKRWPQDAQGWTILSTPSKTILVSATGPVKTLAAGLALLEKGKHQALLLKRGETFDGVALDSKLSGLDPDHLMVIGAYGTGPRPKLVFKGTEGLVVSSAGSNVAFLDLDLDGYKSTAHAGIRTVQNSGMNVLIEGVRIAGFQNGIAADYQSPDEKPAFTNLVIRRSQIIDNYPKDSGHSQGIYVAKAKAS